MSATTDAGMDESVSGSGLPRDLEVTALDEADTERARRSWAEARCGTGS